MAGAERFAGFNPDARASRMLARERVRAGDNEAPGAHSGQTIERHRHPVGGGHILLYKM
jgi:hypothetical protein